MSDCITLHIKLGNAFRSFYNIPRNALVDMTTRPLKYLRYLGFVTTGVEGVLSASMMDSQVDDTFTDVADLLQEYYFIPQG